MLQTMYDTERFVLLEENSILREKYKTIKEKTEALSAAVERYTRQDISRAQLLQVRDDLNRTINPPKYNPLTNQ